MDNLEKLKKLLSEIEKENKKIKEINNKLNSELFLKDNEILEKINEKIEKFIFEWFFQNKNIEKHIAFEKIWKKILIDVKDINNGLYCNYNVVELFNEINNKHENLQKTYLKQIEEYKKIDEKYILFIVMLIVVIIPIFFQFRWLDYFINFFK